MQGPLPRTASEGIERKQGESCEQASRLARNRANALLPRNARDNSPAVAAARADAAALSRTLPSQLMRRTVAVACTMARAYTARDVRRGRVQGSSGRSCSVIARWLQASDRVSGRCCWHTAARQLGAWQPAHNRSYPRAWPPLAGSLPLPAPAAAPPSATAARRSRGSRSRLPSPIPPPASRARKTWRTVVMRRGW